MTVTRGQHIPVPRKILVFRHLHLDTGVRFVTGLRLAPDTNVGIQAAYVGYEVVVVVSLVGPHSVLDIPVQHFQFLPRRLRAGWEKEKCCIESRYRDPEPLNTHN